MYMPMELVEDFSFSGDERNRKNTYIKTSTRILNYPAEYTTLSGRCIRLTLIDICTYFAKPYI